MQSPEHFRLMTYILGTTTGTFALIALVCDAIIYCHWLKRYIKTYSKRD